MSLLFEFREYIGYAAGVLATMSFLPQVKKTFKERRSRDISLGMYVLFCSGVFLWLIYGILIGSAPLLISNIVTLLLSGTILILKIKYDGR